MTARNFLATLAGSACIGMAVAWLSAAVILGAAL
jgi:hypothetical protein